MRETMDRRHFLAAAGTGVGALVAAACGERPSSSDSTAARADTARVDTAGARTTTARSRPGRSGQIGVQLFTVRDRMKADLPGTLAALAAIGYREVEFAGYFQYEKDPKALRALLDGHGLTAPSVHVPIDTLRSKLAATLAAAEVLGHRYVVCPSIDAGKGVDDFRRTAVELDRIGEACRERGIRFGYHNHDFEFKRAGETSFYDVLLNETGPKRVTFEMDLFWATKAGEDPVDFFRRYGDRFPLWHVKDMRDVHGAQEVVAVGEGEIDYAGIFEHAGEAGLDHFFVEHDDPKDSLASARTSYDNLRRLLS